MKKIWSFLFFSIMAWGMIGCGCQNKVNDDMEEAKGMFRPMNIGMVQANKGIYVSGVYTGFLYYIDEGTGNTTVLRNKPNCDHPKSTECNGFFPGVGRTLFWYDNYLYRANPAEGELILYRIYPDGSGYDQYAVLGNTDSQSIKAGCMANGIFYYATSAPIKSENDIRETEIFDIFKIEINGSGKPQKVTSVEAKNPAFISMESGNNGIWVQIQWRENTMEKRADVYHLKNGETELIKEVSGIKEAKMNGPSVFDDRIYYTSEGTIWEYSNGNTESIVKIEKSAENVRNPIIYGDWIFEDSGNKIMIYKKDGTYVNTVDYDTIGIPSMEKQTTCYLAGVTNKGLYLDFYSSQEESLYFCSFEKALTEKKIEWELVIPSL